MDEPPDLETQKAWKRALTVRDLLRHQAGFPAGPHYNDPDFDMVPPGAGPPGCNPCYALGREATLEAIFKTPLLYAPGTRTVYSDVDYMLLTFVVEKLTGQRLDAYMKENFYAPLGLEHITFLPLENGFAAEDCAATELNGNTRDGHVSFEGIRTETLQGEVHDERAWYCMEGVSGHAGLFANAADLAKLASVMLTGGYGEHRFFSRNVMDLFTAPKALDFGQWGLGWWREGDDQRPWYFGTQAAPDTVGHQGWTGTLAMIDPSRELVVVYLTNKINSRVLSDAEINKFVGSCYTASTLGFVPQILSIGMDAAGDVSGPAAGPAGRHGRREPEADPRGLGRRPPQGQKRPQQDRGAEAQELAGVTRSRAGALIRDGQVRVDGAPQTKAGFKLRPGMAVRAEVPPAAAARVAAEDIDLDIVYQDDDLAVVFKPSGMVVHPAAGNASGTLVNALLRHLDNLSGIGGEIRPGIVHRIDKDTSGCCWWRRTTWRTCRCPSRSRPTACSGPTGPSSSAASGRTRAPWRAPSGGTPRTARRWPSCRTGGRRPPTGRCWSGCAARR